MDDWWTYSIADLILFTPETYFHLFELYHRAWWPLQLACITIAIAMLLCLWLKPAWSDRGIAVLLAASWAWVGCAFLHLRFAPIHWVANWYAVAFVLQALLLFIYGISPRGLELETGNPMRALHRRYSSCWARCWQCRQQRTSQGASGCRRSCSR